MNELYPIIRRKRRPLVTEDAPPVVAKSVEPVKSETVSREGGEVGEVKQSDASVTEQLDT